MFAISPAGFAAPAPHATELYLWLDAAAPRLMSVDVGSGAVATMRCRATNRLWEQTTAGRQPVLESVAAFKQKVLNFHYVGGLSKSLTSTAAASNLNSGYTMIWVGDTSVSTTNSYNAFVLGQSTATNSVSSANNYSMLYKSPPSPLALQTYQPAGYRYSNTLTSTTVNVYAHVVPAMGTAASSVKLYHNNSEVSYAGASGTLSGTYNPTVLGSYDTLYQSWGRCGELLVYPRELNTTELTSVYNYLTAKWVT